MGTGLLLVLAFGIGSFLNNEWAVINKNQKIDLISERILMNAEILIFLICIFHVTG